MAPSQYISAYPPKISVDPAYVAFFESFYKISDTPTAHDDYAAQLTPDATLIMGPTKAQGSEAIVALRKTMWEKVASRNHFPAKVFPFGDGSDELMLYGTVDYELKEGAGSTKDWSARAKMVKEDGVVRMSFYQVYLG
jgi:hypothetical protein